MKLRPKYHFTPKSNWMNDPNGLCYHNGLFHLYYQYNPFGICWGCMHWGHATSKDMINWNYEDIALKYDNEYDKDGCFSGLVCCSPFPSSTQPLRLHVGPNLNTKRNPTECRSKDR